MDSKADVDRNSLANAIAYARRVEKAARGAAGALRVLSDSQVLEGLPADAWRHEGHSAAHYLLEMIHRDLTAALNDEWGQTALAYAHA